MSQISPANAAELCTVVAIFTPKPEHFEEVKALLQRVTPRVHNEAGCEFYALHQEVTGKLIYVEAWTTRELWQQHMQEPTVHEILSGVEGKLVCDVEVYEMANLPVAGSGKGSLAKVS